MPYDQNQSQHVREPFLDIASDMQLMQRDTLLMAFASAANGTGLLGHLLLIQAIQQWVTHASGV